MISTDTQSFRMTIIAMGNARVSQQVAARAAVQSAGAVLLYRVNRNIRRVKYSLQDLADMDHPYAKRHRGGIRTDVLGGEYRYRPYLVHRRSGAMLASLRGGMTQGPVLGYEVGFRPGVPWIPWVVQGTRRMHGRDVIWLTAHERGTKKAMMRAVVSVLGKGLRLQAAVRFSGV